jgi:hypothetical protein
MKYMSLDQKGNVMAEYIWIDGHNGVRSKTKVRTHTCLTMLMISMFLMLMLALDVDERAQQRR